MHRNKTKMSLISLLWLLVLFVALGAGELSNGVPRDNDEMELDTSMAASCPSASDFECQCPKQELTEQSSHGARLAYLIQVHNERTAVDASYLFRALRAPRTIIMVHVDTKFEWDVFTNSTLYKEAEACPCGASVHVESVHSAEWSTWSMNDPTFWGMETAMTRFAGQWDVFLNLSGDSMPVYTPEKMAELFNGPLSGINFVTSSSCVSGLVPTNVYAFPEYWHKRGHYTTNPDGNPIISYVDSEGHDKTMTLEIHFGSQWMALLPDFVEYLVTSLKREDSLPSRFKKYLVQAGRLMTDETFIPTLLMYVQPFNSTLPELTQDGTLKSLPSMWDIRYERMDENVPSAFGDFPTTQRYEVANSSLADKVRPWGPYFLGVYDLKEIKESGALFVRKVSVEVDPNIVHMLPVTNIDDLPSIGWPNEVKVSKKVDWEQKKRDLTRKIKKEQQEKEKERE